MIEIVATCPPVPIFRNFDFKVERRDEHVRRSPAYAISEAR
jgi:hypothetical protein